MPKSGSRIVTEKARVKQLTPYAVIFPYVRMGRSITGFTVDGIPANSLRDRWGRIHARQMHPALYDPELMMPSRLGAEYLLPIFTRAVGHDDLEYQRHASFDPGNLFRPYHSVNTDINKRIRYLGGLP